MNTKKTCSYTFEILIYKYDFTLLRNVRLRFHFEYMAETELANKRAEIG